MVDWWSEISLALASFLDQHGLLAAFVFLLIEEAGVPVPVPGDVLMLILGEHAREGRVQFWQAVLVTEAGTVIGASVLYFAARQAGRGLVYRYGRFIRLTPRRLDDAERWLRGQGPRAVFLGRLVPGLRIVTAVACGVFGVPFRIFFPAMSLGALLYILVYTTLGYFLGPPVLALLEQVHIPFGLLGSLLPLAVILFWTFRARLDLDQRQLDDPVERERTLRASTLAGGVATVASTLLLNVIINLAGGLAFQAPGTIVEQTAIRLAFAFAREVQPILLFVAVPVYLAVGILWAVLYSWIVEADAILPESWPDWLKGTVFAILPLLFSLGVAMPVLGLGFFGFGAAGPVVVFGEVLRHAAYGSLLGLLYPVFRSRRLLKGLAPTTDEVPPASVASA
jgi:membrane protein DedA with SNARE-associated domain